MQRPVARERASPKILLRRQHRRPDQIQRGVGASLGHRASRDNTTGALLSSLDLYPLVDRVSDHGHYPDSLRMRCGNARKESSSLTKPRSASRRTNFCSTQTPKTCPSETWTPSQYLDLCGCLGLSLVPLSCHQRRLSSTFPAEIAVTLRIYASMAASPV